MKLRINAVDFNLTKPLNEFDDMYCPFSNLPLKSVPVIRIFGKLVNGQNACAHVHGIFPYFFIEYNHNINPTQGWLSYCHPNLKSLIFLFFCVLFQCVIIYIN